MRIAYVTETWAPEVNGVAITAVRVVQHLREHEHQVQVIRPSQGKSDVADSNTLLLARLPIPLHKSMHFGFPAARRLEREWRATPPDVVHVATAGPLAWSAVSAARRLGIPVTSDLRTRLDPSAWSVAGAAVSAYLRAFHNRALCTFVPTEEVRAELARTGFRNLVVSGRGVDSLQFAPNYRSHALRRVWQADGPVVLYVGRLCAEKNVNLVVESFALIKAARPDAKLVFVGNGPMREQLARRCPDAIFAGVQRGQVLSAYYASADILLFPSLTDTFGNVTLEAMASGLAVVAYETAAAAVHIRHGHNGMVARRGNEDAFKHAAVTVAVDDALRRALGAGARAEVMALSWDRVLSDFESELRYAKSRFRIVAGRSAAPSAWHQITTLARDTLRNSTAKQRSDAAGSSDIAALLAACLDSQKSTRDFSTRSTHGGA